ncbi:MAG TPA: DUF1638 domain-containing protein [Aggregatilineales bacterium]|nr:DUF1638 domain-containing protein [Aggregatilineales bacterium]
MARYLALTCEALARSIYAIAAASPHTVYIHLLEQGLHNHPRHLRTSLQEQIDAVEPGKYEAILLVYGLCGTSTAGLTARHTPLVIPRAHDCITLYLGSAERYQEEFDAQPGTYWYSVDYMERQPGDATVALGAANLEQEEAQYEQYVKKYGVETADMLMEEMRKWSQHYTRAAFIDTGLGDTPKYEQMARAKAQREGWTFERKQGNRRLLDMLVNANWPEAEFLVVPPGHTIKQAGRELMRAVPAVEITPG